MLQTVHTTPCTFDPISAFDLKRSTALSRIIDHPITARYAPMHEDEELITLKEACRLLAVFTLPLIIAERLKAVSQNQFTQAQTSVVSPSARCLRQESG